MDFFGTPWSDLTLERVEEFLADQEDEGLNWETKGTEIRREHVLKAVSGFANQVGGFLLLGARRDGGRWELDGVPFPDEPPVWLSNIIGAGLDPRPTFDVQAWEVDGGRHVAIVQVEPVATPPCVTSSGQVYQRLPGKTEAVTEAAILTSLFDRGQRARDLAEATSTRAVEKDFGVGLVPLWLFIHVAVAPTGKPDDVAKVLFSRRYETQIREAFERLPREPLFPYPSQGQFAIMHTHAKVVADPQGDDLQRWRIRCQWDGSVLVSCCLYPREGEARLGSNAVFTEAVRPAANEALRLTKELGGFGPGHIVLQFETGGFHLAVPNRPGDLGFPASRAQAWTDDFTLSDEALARWEREFLRNAGVLIHEPDEAPADGA